MGGPFIVYFTGYLATIPFGHAPNYVFTLKPSPQLEMELNHLLGDDTIEYTPFDYSLDEQEITYVTDGVDWSKLVMILRPRNSPQDIVKLNQPDLDYVNKIKKQEPFELKIVDGVCYFFAQVNQFKPRIINHPKFKTPIIVKAGDPGEMLVDARGAFFAEYNECEDVYPYGSADADPSKEIALEAYFQYPSIHKDIEKYQTYDRRTFTFTLARFDSFIANF
ncbi:hypothetical protein [Alkalimarinus coralli]|uniref:hypothetical protein n=1 Tax=Alkalimarinus coralli TaxID=2935863 RepID=UPI00202B6D33|nr:hypothetical protein [Alkalimarinus coralli]